MTSERLDWLLMEPDSFRGCLVKTCLLKRISQWFTPTESEWIKDMAAYDYRLLSDRRRRGTDFTELLSSEENLGLYHIPYGHFGSRSHWSEFHWSKSNEPTLRNVGFPERAPELPELAERHLPCTFSVLCRLFGRRNFLSRIKSQRILSRDTFESSPVHLRVIPREFRRGSLVL